jgi:hypothetical protein
MIRTTMISELESLKKEFHSFDDIESKKSIFITPLTFNKRYLDYDEIRKENDAMIKSYNEKPGQRHNKDRRFESMDDYVEKRQSHKKVNSDFHGVEFIVLSKIGDSQIWDYIFNVFEKQGVCRDIVIDTLNDGFDRYCQKFDKFFSNHFKCIALRSGFHYTNIPCCVICIRSCMLHERSGLPVTNLSTILTSMYGDLYTRALLSAFRNDVDAMIVNAIDNSLKDLANAHRFEFDGMQLLRLSDLKSLINEDVLINNDNSKKLEVSNLSETDVREMREMNLKLMETFEKVEYMVRKMGISIDHIAKKAYEDGLDDSDIEECMVILEKNNLLITKLGRWLSNGGYKTK